MNTDPFNLHSCPSVCSFKFIKYMNIHSHEAERKYCYSYCSIHLHLKHTGTCMLRHKSLLCSHCSHHVFFLYAFSVLETWCNWKQGLGRAVICLGPSDFDCCVLLAWGNEIANWVLCRSSNFIQDLMENDKNFIPRHFKTIWEFGYHTSVVLFCNFCGVYLFVCFFFF